MRLAAFLTGVVLTALSGTANAMLLHQTCKQGVSPNLKFMCYIGFNSSTDFVAYEYADAYCRAVSAFYPMSSITVHQTSTPSLILHIYAGCPEGYWEWFGVTRTKLRTSPLVGDWVAWEGDGADSEVFSCFN
jgi:hypothetical protein